VYYNFGKHRTLARICVKYVTSKFTQLLLTTQYLGKNILTHNVPLQKSKWTSGDTCALVWEPALYTIQHSEKSINADLKALCFQRRQGL